MDTLVPRALVGTDQCGPAASSSEDDPDTAQIANLIDAVGAESAEAQLLLRAGVRSIYRFAGARPDGPAAIVDRCPPETLRACSPVMAALLREMLVGEQRELLPLAVVEMRSRGFALPPQLLPAALACPKEQRILLRGLLGVRGRWLAGHNPAWSWASAGRRDDGPPTDDALRIFNEGTLAERRAILQQIRRSDPATARVWLADVWRQEKADVRRALIRVLGEGLGADDESFLEAALRDRASTVRSHAAALLRTLPASAYTARMATYALPYIEVQAPTIQAKLKAAIDGRDPAPTLLISLPQAFDPAWAKDSLLDAAPGGIGRRGWWLSQLLAATPLTTWTQLQERPDPETLLRGLRGHELAAPVLDGWTSAALHQRATPWMPHLWDLWRRMGGGGALNPQPQAALIAAMDPAAAEARICDLLSDGTLLVDLLRALPRPWPGKVAEAYLAGLHPWISRLAQRRPQSDDPWLESLRIAGAALPSGSLDLARTLPSPPQGSSDWYRGKWQTAFTLFMEALRLRQRLAEEMRP